MGRTTCCASVRFWLDLRPNTICRRARQNQYKLSRRKQSDQQLQAVSFVEHGRSSHRVDVSTVRKTRIREKRTPIDEAILNGEILQFPDYRVHNYGSHRCGLMGQLSRYGRVMATCCDA